MKAKTTLQLVDIKNLGLIRSSLLIYALLLIFALWFYKDIFQLWWTFDDPYLLDLVIFNNPIDFFLTPEKYHQLSIANFTPLLFFSFWIDYKLFGFSAFFFYLHQIIALASVSFLLFLLLKKWHHLLALLLSILFLVCGPSSVCVSTLMTRHYIEGAIFALLTIYLTTICFSSNHNCPSRFDKAQFLLITICYFIACCYKEVYILLFALVPFLPTPPQTPKKKILHYLIIALICYVLLRFYFLNSFGGYSLSLDTTLMSFLVPDYNLLFNKFLLFFVKYFSIAPRKLTNTLITSYLLVTFLILARQKHLSLSLGMLICGIIPIIPLLKTIMPFSFLGDRLLFHLSILITISLFYFFFFLNKKGFFFYLDFIIILILLWFVSLNSLERLHKEILPVLTRHSKENIFFFYETPQKILLNPLAGHHWASLSKIRWHLKKEITPNVAHSPFIFTPLKTDQIFCYNNKKEKFINCSNNIKAEINDFFQKKDLLLPLQVDIKIHQGKFRVKCAPNKGTFWFLYGYQSMFYEGFQIPNSFTGKLFESPHTYFVRIMRMLHNGKWNISPEWQISLNGDHEIYWQTPDNYANKH